MDKQAFLAAYNLTEDDLIEADISWDMICHIYYNYKRLEKDLRDIVKYKGHYIEIQGRTLFEEGWSEIDHDIVYKSGLNDEMLEDYSRMLNRLSGLADEMSSYFRRIKEKE